MLATTIKILRSGLEADPTLTPTDRARILATVRNHERAPRETPAPGPEPPRILRRREVAQRLSCSLRTVDKLDLPKVRLPGRTRAAGFLESDINALLESK